MKTLHFPLLAIVFSVVLAGCNPGTHVSTDRGNVSSNGKSIKLHADGHPDAKISTTGELTIDGKPVAVNAAQRALLQSYHTQLNAMTSDGIEIGKQGATLAGTAISEAIKGAIKGDGEQVDARIEAEARKIEQQAMQLCKRLGIVKASQDALAAQLPVFKPYATIEVSDLDDCGSSQSDSYAAGKEVGGALAKVVKGGKVEAAEPADSGDAAARADAAAESDASTR